MLQTQFSNFIFTSNIQESLCYISIFNIPAYPVQNENKEIKNWKVNYLTSCSCLSVNIFIFF